MIQDIGSKKLVNAYDPQAHPAPDSYIFYIENGSAAVRTSDDSLLLPRFAECPADADYTYLFAIDDEKFFLAEENAALPQGCAYVPVRALRREGFGPRHLIYAAFTALQLSGWYRDNRYCGTCGSPTRHDDTERAVRCPGCGRVIYPRIIPAVIVGVTNGDKLLLTKYNRRPGVTYYALVAGFTEIGETLEQTVEREVMEEVGLRVKNIRYYKSQPWGIADDILAGFYCDVDGDTTIRLDENELREGVWVPRGEITGQPDDFSLTNEMMMRFHAGLENEPV